MSLHSVSKRHQDKKPTELKGIMNENQKNPQRELDPSEMRSWDEDTDRKAGRQEFERKTPPGSDERDKCITDGVYARRMFAEWGHFYIEGEKAPAHFPDFDPTWEITKIPSATVFRVYETKKDRPKRDEQVVLILQTTDEELEDLDQVWRCTYTPYREKRKRYRAPRS
jgi:hypothetical protein